MAGKELAVPALLALITAAPTVGAEELDVGKVCPVFYHVITSYSIHYTKLYEIAYTQVMARDVQTLNDQDCRPEELESDYYRGLYAIDSKRNEIEAHRALENWVPLIAALGSIVISAMLLFKGLKHMDLGLTTLHNYLIMGMVGALVWMATFIFAKTLKGTALGKSTFLMFSWMQVRNNFV